MKTYSEFNKTETLIAEGTMTADHRMMSKPEEVAKNGALLKQRLEQHTGAV